MTRMDRRDFVRQAGALIAAGLLAPGRRSWGSDAGPLNVLVVKSDEHNPAFWSLGRFNQVETPNMKRLAERGVVFANTYCPSPLCSPSRSAFCAGKRVHALQTYNNCNIFKHDYPCYGRILAEAGVHTVHLGKADFYNQAAALGFSEVLSPGDRGRPDVLVSRNPLAVRADGQGRASGFGIGPGNLQHDTLLADQAVAWIHETAPGIASPWTLEVNLSKPHFPLRVSEELWKIYADREDLPLHGRDEETAHHPYALDLRQHFQTDLFKEEQIRGLRRGYYGCVTFIDQQLGRILDALEEKGLTDTTVVAYTSDHGEMLGKFGMWWKCSLYEDSVRVPLIVAGPGFIPGTCVETPVDHLDLQATFFHATGRVASRPKDWSGTPLQEIQSTDPNRVVFSEYHGHGTRGSGFLIRKGDWKLLYNCAAPHQLFNLCEDPNELSNLALKALGKMAELEAELRTICDPDLEGKRAEDFIHRQLDAARKEGLL